MKQAMAVGRGVTSPQAGAGGVSLRSARGPRLGSRAWLKGAAVASLVWLAWLGLCAPLARAAEVAGGTLVTTEGTLDVLIADDFERNRSETLYALTEARSGQVFKLAFEGPPPADLRTGMRVRARGRTLDGHLVVAEGSGEAALSAEGDFQVLETPPLAAQAFVAVDTHTLLAIIVNLTDASVTASSSSINSRLFSTTSDSVKGFYEECSYGAITFSGKVVGPYKINMSKSDGVDYLGWARAADGKARDGGNNPDNYDHVVYVVPAGIASWAGLATVGGDRSWIAAPTSLHVYCHEIGHNLGMLHASSDSDDNGSVNVEYGDTSCIMGTGPVVHPNLPHKRQMGWIWSSKVKTVTSSGTFNIAPAHADPSDTERLQGLRLDIDGSSQDYYFSYRKHSGYDGDLSSSFADKVSVHRWSGSGNTLLVKTLSEGQTFDKWSSSDFKVRVAETSSSGVIFDVLIRGSVITRVWSDSGGYLWNSTARWSGLDIPNSTDENVEFGGDTGSEQKVSGVVNGQTYTLHRVGLNGISPTVNQLRFQDNAAGADGWLLNCGDGTSTLTVNADPAILTTYAPHLIDWGGGSARLNLKLGRSGENTVQVGSGLQINAAISGASSGSGLTKTGSGTLTLGGGSSNTYQGTTRINDGTLVCAKTGGAAAFRGDVALGDGGGAVVLRAGQPDQFGAGAALAFQNGTQSAKFQLLGCDQTLYGLSMSGTLAIIQNAESESGIRDATLTLDLDASATWSGYLRDKAGGTSGSLGLAKLGGGTLTLSGNQITCTGSTTVSGGRLKFANTGALNTPIVNRATVELNATSGDSWTLKDSKTLSGSGAWIKTGSGRATLENATLTTTGRFELQAGALRNNNNAGNWSGSTADMDIDAGAILDLYGDAVYVDQLTGSGVVQNGYGNASGHSGAAPYVEKFVVGVAHGSSSFAGVIRNNAGSSAPAAGTAGGGVQLEKVGAGTLTLTGANTYSGATLVNGGTLKVNGSKSGAGAVSVNAGGTLAGTGSVAGTTTVNGGGRIAPGDGGVGTLAVAELTLQDGGALVVEFRAGSANDMIDAGPGAVNIAAGGVYLVAEGTDTPWAPATLPVTVNLIRYGSLVGSPEGLFVLNPVAGLNYIFGTSGNWITLTIETDTTPSWTGADASPNWSVAANWTNGPAAAGEGLRFGAASPTGTDNHNDFAAGTRFRGIAFANAGSYALSGNAVNLIGSVVNATTNRQTIGLEIVMDGAGRLFSVAEAAGSLTINGAVGQDGSTRGLTKTGAGTLTLNGPNTYAGNTTVLDGALVIGPAGRLNGGAYAGAVALSAERSVFAYNGTADQTLGGNVTGQGSLAKGGAGTLTLTGSAGSYTGATTIDGGWLQFGDGTASVPLLSSAYAIAGGATLGVNTLSANTVASRPKWAATTGAGTLVLRTAGAGIGAGDWGAAALPAGFTGTLRIERGRVYAPSGASLGGAAAVAVEAGGQLGLWAGGTFPQAIRLAGAGHGETDYEAALRLAGYNAPDTILAGGITLGGDATLGAGGSGGTAGQGRGIIRGVISGDYAVTFGTAALDGTVVLETGNTYTGATALRAGVLQLAGGDNRLPAGTVLDFGGTTVLDVAGFSQTVYTLIFPELENVTATVTGGGTLRVGGATDLQIGPGGVNVGSRTCLTTLNMSGLSRFAFDAPANVFRIGLKPGTSNAGALGTVASVTLAKSTTLSAATLAIGDVGASSHGGTSVLRLGADNTLQVTAIGVALSGRSNGSLEFAGGLTDPALLVRNTDGVSAVSSWEIGAVSADSNTTWTAAANLAGGSVDALVTGMTVGSADTRGAANRAGTINASFTMGRGKLAVGTLTVGLIAGGGSVADAFAANGAFTLNHADGLLEAGTLNLAGNTIAATGSGAKAVTGTFNLTAGTLRAGIIQKGPQTGSATAVDAAVVWTAGTIRNYDASTDLTISSGLTKLELTGTGLHAFNIDASRQGTVNAVISGTGALTKQGGGILKLNAANTYGGATKVEGGTLLVNGAHRGGGAYAISSGGTLAGTGSVSGTTTVGSGGRIAPGDGGVGTLTVGGLTVQNGGALAFEFNAAPANDTLDASAGTVTINGGGVYLLAEGTTSPWAPEELPVTVNLVRFGALAGSLDGLHVLTPVAGLSYVFGTSGAWITLTIAKDTSPAWSGGDASPNWSVAANWSEGQAVAGAGVRFGAAAITDADNNNDFAPGTRFKGIAFANSGVYTLRGNAVNLIGNVVNATANPQTIGLNLVMDGGDRAFSVIDAAGSLTISGAVGQDASARGLTKTGAGTLTLNGPNTYAGGTVVLDGALVIGAAGRLSGGTYAGAITLSVESSAFAYNNSTASQTLNGAVTGSGSISKAGTGTLTLNGLNTYTGNTTVHDGALVIGATGRLCDGTYAGAIALGATTSAFAHNSSTLNQTLSGPIEGLGSISKTGAGTLTLTAANTFTGRTTLNSGTLILTGGDNRLNPASTLCFTASGTLTLDLVNQTLGEILFSNAATASHTFGGGGSLTVNGAANLDIAAKAQSIGLTVNMSGLNAFTYDNASGFFRVGGVSGADDYRYSWADVTLPAVTAITASSLGVGDNGYGGGNAANTIWLRLGQESTFHVDALVIGSRLASASCVFRAGLESPSLVLRGADGGTSVRTIVVGQQNNNVANNITHAFDVSTGSLDALADTVIIGQSLDRLGTENGVFSMGAGSLTVTNVMVVGQVQAATAATRAGVGTFTLTGAGVARVRTLLLGDRQTTVSTATTTGSVNLSGGTLYVQTLGPGAGAGTRSINWYNGTFRNYDEHTDLTIRGGLTRLELRGEDLHAFHIDAGRQGTVSQALSGDGPLTKRGEGMLTLTGANTYSGATVVEEGALLVYGVHSGGDTYTVNSGAALGGGGSIGAAVTVLEEGVLAPGGTNATAVLTVTDLTLGEASALNWNQGESGADRVSISGTLTLPTEMTVDVSARGTAELTYPAVLLDCTGGILAGAADLSGWTVNGVGADVEVKLDAIGRRVLLDRIPRAQTWGGGGSNSLWTTAGNWTGGTAPVETDVLIFTGSNTCNTNDFPAGTDFYGLRFAADAASFTLAGNAVDLFGNLVSGSTNRQAVAHDLTLPFVDCTVDTGGGAVAIGGAIGGERGLVKAGNGTLQLAGSNTYAGGTLLLSGTVELGHSHALGSTGTVSFAGGTLRFSAANSTDYSARFSTAEGQAYQLDTAGQNVALAAALSSAGGTLTKGGAGMLTLAGANNYDGGTRIDAGVLQVGSGGGSGTLGAGSVLNNGALVFNRNNLYQVDNVISGGGSVRNAGAFVYLDMAARNTYTGGTFIDSGILRLRTDLGGGARLGSGPVSVAAGASYEIWAPAAVTLDNDLVLNGATGVAGRPALNQNGGSGKVTLSGSVLLNATSDIGRGGSSGNDLELQGALSGPGGLIVKEVDRSLTLAGVTTNTYAGTTRIVSGTLVCAKTGGATALPGAVELGDGSAAVTLRTLQPNQFGPATALAFQNGSQNAKFQLHGNNQTIHGLTMSGTAPIIQNTEAETGIGDATLTLNLATNATWSGYLRSAAGGSGNLAIAKLGAGVLTLSGANITYGGATTVNGGTLQFANTGALNTPIANHAVVEINATSGDSWVLANGKALSGNGVWIKTGAGRASFYNATLTPSGRFVLQEGTLRNGNNAGNWSGCTADMDVRAGAILDLYADAIYVDELTGNGFVQNGYGNATGQSGASAYIEKLVVGVAGGSATFAGVIRDNAGGTAPAAGAAGGGVQLEKTGAGTLTLTGTNTYTGTTVVNGGTLTINGVKSGAGAVSVNAGGALAGMGRLSGMTTVGRGGRIAPGDGGVGTLTVGGLTLQDGCTLAFEFNAGPANDTIDAGAGAVTLNGGVYLLAEGTTAPWEPGLPSVTYNLIRYGSLAGSVGTLFVLNPAAGRHYVFGARGGWVTVRIGTAPAWTGGEASPNWSAPANWTDGAAAAGQVLTFGAATLTDTENDNDFAAGTPFNGITFANNGIYTLGGNAVNLAGNVVNGTPNEQTIRLDMVLDGAGRVFGVTEAAGSLTLNGAVGQDGSARGLTKTGAGTLTLNGPNTYTGGTTVDDGTLVIGPTGRLNGGTYAGAVMLSTAGSVLAYRNSTENQTLSGVLAGPGSVSKAGAGTLTLTGANTHGGVTTVEGGVLQVGDGGTAGSLAAGSAVTIGAGGTLRQFRGDAAADLALGHSVSGAGNWSFLGTGTINQSRYVPGGDSSDFTGTVIADRARINVDNYTSDLGRPGVIRVLAGGQLLLQSAGVFTNAAEIAGNGWSETTGALGAIRLQNGVNASGVITLTGDARLAAHGNTGTLSGRLAESGGAHALDLRNTHTSNGSTLTLQNTSTRTGITQVNDVIVVVNSSAAFGGGNVLLNGSVLNARIQLGNGVNVTNSLAAGGLGLIGVTGRGVLEVTGTAAATWSGPLSFARGTTAGGHLYTDAGAWLTLSGAITAPVGVGVMQRGGNVIYSGGGSYQQLWVEGCAKVGANDGLNTDAAVSLAAAGTVGTLDLTGVSQTLADVDVVDTRTATLTGTGGTLRLGANDFRLGSVTEDAKQTLNAGGLTTLVFDGATKVFNVGPAPTGSGDGEMTMPRNTRITAQTFSVADGGGGNNTSAAYGTVNLGLVNTINATNFRVGYSTTRTEDYGTLRFASGLTSPSLKIRGTGGGDDDRANITIGYSAADSQYNYGSGTVDLTTGVTGSTLDAMVGAMVLGNLVSDNGGSGAVGTFVMGLGTLDATSILVGRGSESATGNGVFTLGGAGTVKAGTLTLGERLSGTVNATFNLNGGGTLRAQKIGPGAGTAARNFNWNDGTIRNYDDSTDLTIASGLTRLELLGAGRHAFDIDADRQGTVNQAVSGAGALTKTGAGTLTLTGANTYGGATSVEGGALLVNGAHTGGGATTVSTNSTLGGTGRIAGALTVRGGGALVPAGEGAAGAFTVGGDATFEPDAVLRVECGPATNDVAVVAGKLALSERMTVNIAALEGARLPSRVVLFRYGTVAAPSGFGLWRVTGPTTYVVSDDPANRQIVALERTGTLLIVR